MRIATLKCEGPQGAGLPKGQPCQTNITFTDGEVPAIPRDWFVVEHKDVLHHFCSPYCTEQWLNTLWKPEEQVRP